MTLQSFIAVASIIGAVVAGVWMIAAPVDFPHPLDPIERSIPERVNAAARSEGAPASVRTSPDPASFIENKYRHLLADIAADASVRMKTVELLVEWERLADIIKMVQQQVDGVPADAWRAEERLAVVDAELRSILHSADYRRFEMLRNSDAEQHHLAELVGGLRNIVPLSEQQARAILEAKLRHKARYETILSDANPARANLSAAERNQTRNVVLQALAEYRNNFLLEAKQFLPDDEQYALLSNYETTEFDREIERLQAVIGH